MSNRETPSDQSDYANDCDALSARRRIVNGVLYDAQVPAARLHDMAVTVAGRLMTNRAMIAAEQRGARRFIEVMFGTLERLEERRGNPSAAPELSLYGNPFETKPCIIDAGTLLLDTNKRIKDFEASDELLSPEAMGRHWVKNELADLYDHFQNPQSKEITIPLVTPEEMPSIERC